jgi:S-adenosylmethionine decarboxylase proenzyme
MIGMHVLIDGHGCTATALLTDAAGIAVLLREAAQGACMTPLSEPVVHAFPGGGLTAFLPLAESHIAIHTYPERAFFAADLFTCGPNAAPEIAVALLLDRLRPERPAVRRIVRGDDV